MPEKQPKPKTSPFDRPAKYPMADNPPKVVEPALVEGPIPSDSPTPEWLATEQKILDLIADLKLYGEKSSRHLCIVLEQFRHCVSASDQHTTNVRSEHYTEMVMAFNRMCVAMADENRDVLWVYPGSDGDIREL